MYNTNESFEKSQLFRCLRLLSTDEFAPLIRHLKDILSDQYETLSKANDATLIFRTQGRIAALEELLDAVAVATKNS